MGDPISLLGLGLGVASQWMGAKRAEEAKTAAYQAEEERKRRAKEYETKVGESEAEIQRYLSSPEMSKYVADVEKMYMDVLAPQVAQWAYARGVAGGTPEQEAMIKAGAEAARAGVAAKANIAQQLESKRRDILNRYRELISSGVSVPYTGIEAGDVWSKGLQDISSGLARLNFYDTFLRKMKGDEFSPQYFYQSPIAGTGEADWIAPYKNVKKPEIPSL